jgi:Family of unknown function (DUF5677)
MSSQKEKCLERIRIGLNQLSVIKSEYAALSDKQAVILLHFIGRGEQLIKASLMAEALHTPLQVLCRVFCEDFILACWVSQSLGAAEEYEKGVQAEVAKMMGVSLSNSWAILRNKHSKEPVTREFMETEFIPKLKALKTPRTNINQIAREIGLEKLYDILYRASSLELHGNTFGLALPRDDYMGLSAIASILDCLVATLTLPRKPFDPQKILARMRI